jgi:hypothetical protein
MIAEYVYKLGGSFMISREAKAFSEEHGLGWRAAYFRGRCGVLGEVDADIVAAAVGFFPAEVVREAWTAAAGLPAAEAVRGYAAVCHAHARRKLAGLPEAEAARLAELLGAVCGGAEVVGAPLFAGWRAMPEPADPRARAVQLAHTLRELRGGLHLVAVLASGLTPLEAVLGRTSHVLIAGGEANAEFFGWPRPYPDLTDEARERRARAEDLTDTLVGPAFAALSRDENAELEALLGRADKVAFG